MIDKWMLTYLAQAYSLQWLRGGKNTLVSDDKYGSYLLIKYVWVVAVTSPKTGYQVVISGVKNQPTRYHSSFFKTVLGLVGDMETFMKFRIFDLPYEHEDKVALSLKSMNLITSTWDIPTSHYYFEYDLYVSTHDSYSHQHFCAAADDINSKNFLNAVKLHVNSLVDLSNDKDIAEQVRFGLFPSSSE